MNKIIRITERDLHRIITEAVDGITKKIAATSAKRNYKNELFNRNKNSHIIKEDCGYGGGHSSCGYDSGHRSYDYGRDSCGYGGGSYGGSC